MLDQATKPSLLRTISRADTETSLVVPHNSIAEFQHKCGLTEHNRAVTIGAVHVIPNGIIPHNVTRPTGKCTHCENMAKNFLYIESIIRSNALPRDKCKVCSSVLKYLQYINKNILEIFGSYESIAQAAQKFATMHNPVYKADKNHLRKQRALKFKQKVTAMQSTPPSGRHQLVKSKSKVAKKAPKVFVLGGKPPSNSTFVSPYKPKKKVLKLSLKRVTHPVGKVISISHRMNLMSKKAKKSAAKSTAKPKKALRVKAKSPRFVL